MKQIFLLFIGVFFGFQAEIFAQDTRISGTLVHASTFKPIPAAHIVNQTLGKGTISTEEGFFSIPVSIQDTLYVSALGFAKKELIITDSLLEATKNIRLPLEPVVYELAEVNLTPNGPGTFQRDFEKAPIMDEDAPLPGRPSQRMVKANPPPPELKNVFDLLYNQFGSRPQQLRAIQALRAQDQYETWVFALLNEKVLNNYLLLPENWHQQFLEFYLGQAFHPLDKEYQVYLSARETLPYFFQFIR